MKYKIIHDFLDFHFPSIESVVLFGSYINNPSTASDIDLLLISKKFLYSSRESFSFKNTKFHIIKINVSEIFALLSKEYQQGGFYKLIFTKGVVIKDLNSEIEHLKQYIFATYPKENHEIIALELNEILYKLSECIASLQKQLPQLEYFFVYSNVINSLVDWVLFSNSIINVKINNKFKGKLFASNFPIENTKLSKLLIAQKNQNSFLKELKSIINDFKIPINEKQSSDLIFDDYTQKSLVIYIENIFDFEEIKEIITKIKNENLELSFYIYQVDEGNQEKKGCYIVFDNSTMIISNNKQKWNLFFQELFSENHYIFPYNNIFCYPVIKFLGQTNLDLIIKLQTNCVNYLHENKISKEMFCFKILYNYILKNDVNVEEVYLHFLGKLTAITRSSNYSYQNYSKIENQFLNKNKLYEKKILNSFKNLTIEAFNFVFPKFDHVPIWFHFYVIDSLLSSVLKTDYEKLFFLNCYKKYNV